jgi:hypothetical protein
MSLFGKILAILNVVAAIGFIYMAASDYSKRQQWSYAVFRHDLAMNGLPVDENQKDVDGNQIFKNLNQATLTDVFQQAGGQPVKTQLEEVNKKKSEVIGKIDAEPMTVPNILYPEPPTITLETPAQKRAWYLLPFARTITDRDPLLYQIYNPKEEKVPAEALEQLFNDALARNSAGDKQQAIADLLLGLLEPGEGDSGMFGTQAFNRYLTIVGRKAAATALDNQAAMMAQLVHETNDALAAGRAAFAAAHAQGVMRNLDILAVLQKEKETLELQRNQTARQKDLVADRDRQIKDLQGKLANAQKTTRANLAEQEKLQHAFLEAERKLRDANNKNQGLEQEIKKLEEK